MGMNINLTGQIFYSCKSKPDFILTLPCHLYWLIRKCEISNKSIYAGKTILNRSRRTSVIFVSASVSRFL